MSWGHQAMVVTTAHWDGAPGLSRSPALLTIAFGGVAPDAWQTADAGVVVLTEGVAQLTLVFSQRAHLGGVERGLGVLYLAGDATVNLWGETGGVSGAHTGTPSPQLAGAAQGPYQTGSVSLHSPRGTCKHSPHRGPRR